MSVVMEVSFTIFRDSFIRIDRDEFSYNGYRILFDYLEERSEDLGTPYIFNPYDEAGEWTESTYSELEEMYFNTGDFNEDMEEDDRNKFMLDWLGEHTVVAGYNNEIVIYQGNF